MDPQGHKAKPAGTSVTALRAQIQAKPVKGAKLPKHNLKAAAPPPPPKNSKKQQAPADKRDEAAEKAERLAQQHHSTSLLKGKPVKTLYKAEDKPKGGTVSFLIQLVFIVAVCAGGAWLYDSRFLETVDWAAVKEELKLDF